MTEIEAILHCIERTRVDLTSEKAAQADLEAAFRARGFEFRREVRLAPGDIIDFIIDPIGVGVELKLKRAGKMATFRQLARYAKHDEIRALILASNMAMGLPALIEAKPSYLASLGRAWL